MLEGRRVGRQVSEMHLEGAGQRPGHISRSIRERGGLAGKEKVAGALAVSAQLSPG